MVKYNILLHDKIKITLLIINNINEKLMRAEPKLFKLSEECKRMLGVGTRGQEMVPQVRQPAAPAQART